VEHLAHFGLSQDPFRNEPQLDFYFESAAHGEARRRLLRCVRQRKELGLLVGEVGTGKTTVTRVLFEELDPEAYESGLLVLARGVEPEWLRQGIARQLGVEAPAAERAASIRQLYERLVAIHEEGRHAVVLLDEAQSLAGPEVLAELRGLLNFEHDEQRLLTVVLVGTPALDRVLAADPALMGRIELRVELGTLAEAEVPRYLAHRLGAAGGDVELFQPEVAASIAERAGGIPRRLNALADNALFEACLAGRSEVGSDDVERGARELPWAKGSAPALELTETVDEAPADAAEPRGPERTPTRSPDETLPGAWAQAEPVEARLADEPGDPFAAPPEEDELDGIFAELVEED
jgi:general secretion pathway protein A